MDPLSLTASIITIVGVADAIVTICKVYLSSVRGAPEELRVIMIDIGCLKCLIENVKFLSNSGVDRDLAKHLASLAAADGPIIGCKTALKALEELLRPVIVVE